MGFGTSLKKEHFRKCCRKVTKTSWNFRPHRFFHGCSVGNISRLIATFGFGAQVTQRTYEHVAKSEKFDDLRSTRHFGPMAFYLAIHCKVDLLLVDMLYRRLYVCVYNSQVCVVCACHFVDCLLFVTGVF